MQAASDKRQGQEKNITQSRQGAKTPRREWIALAVVIVVVLIAVLPVVGYPLGRDQGEFATIGRGILDGKVPYVDLWNPKPPAVFYVYAAAMTAFGRTVEALRAIDLIIYPIIAYALFRIGRRTAGVRVGLWAALLFGVFYFGETFWTLTQNDGIAILPMVLAMVCAYAAGDRADKRSAAWAFASGALTAWAMWFKYPFALFVIPVIAAYWVTVGRPRVRDVIGYAAGGLLIGVGGIVTMMAIGAWDALLESAILTSQYTAMGATGEGNLLVDGVTARLQHWGVLGALAVVGGMYWVARRPHPQPLSVGEGGSLAEDVSEGDAESGRRANFVRLWRPYGGSRRVWLPVGLWLVVGFAIMAMQLKGYDYHWLPMLPPLVIIGAYGADHLLALLTSRNKSMTLLFAGIVGAMLILPGGIIRWRNDIMRGVGLVMQEKEGEYFQFFVAGDFYAEESVQMARFLRERVVPGDSLFIWGFRPEIYTMSGLNPATRFIFQFPLVADWYPPEWRDQTVETLWAALPPYVLVLEADYMPWVTGSQADSHTLLQEYTELNNWLEYNYERDSQIGPFLIWRRLPPTTS